MSSVGVSAARCKSVAVDEVFSLNTNPAVRSSWPGSGVFLAQASCDLRRLPKQLNENDCNLFHPSGVLLRALLLRFSQAGTIMLTGPWNKKAPQCSSAACLFGIALVLLAFPVAPASAQDPLSAIFGRFGQPQLTTAPPSYGDPWGGLRQAVAVRYETPTSEMDPRFAKQIVSYITDEKPGTVVVDTRSRFLYLVHGGGKAIRYGVGVGRVGFTWSGIKTVSQKAEWPEWTPPAEMLKRRPDLPTWMTGGVDNPLGARAIYLGTTLYRIHGTDEPGTIGQAVSSGCFRMKNDDVIDLYDRVKIGTRVVVI